MLYKSTKSSKLFSLLCVLCMIVSLLGDFVVVKGANSSVTAKDVMVRSNVTVKIEQEYGVVGEPLTAVMADAPVDMVCTYKWDVNGTQVSTTNFYTPKISDLEKTITVKATATGEYAGSYQASMYFSKLPVFYINTEGGKEIKDKVNYITSEFKIQGNETFNSSTTTLYNGGIGIRGRGNTTWTNPKKPYKIKLDTKTDLFGFGNNKHWVLLANYTDESHMRNMLSYNLSGVMGMPYMESTSVSLVLNGVYKGTYQFCEQVRIAESRVDIHDWENYAGDVAKAIYKVEQDNGMTKDERDALEVWMAESDLNWINSGVVTYKGISYTISDYIDDMPEATGGVILELDSYWDEVSKFKSSKDQPLQYKKPEFINTNTTFMTYVKNYIDAFESSISAYDYTAMYDGEEKSYSQLFDMDSLVQFWLVNELFMNVDAMKKSTYMYKDIDGLFYMGPIWDMDWSSDSLVSYGQGSGSYTEWQTKKFSDSAQANQWYKLIIKDPYFAVQAYEAYHAYRENMLEMIETDGIMDTCQALIQESANANASLWYGGGERAFNTQVARLKTFLKNRINWLDSQFASPETLLNSLAAYSPGSGISVEDSGVTETENGVMIEADVTNADIAAVEFCVNGEKIGTEAVTGGIATIRVPESKLVIVKEALNTVQVFGISSSGSVVTVNGKNATDYATFKVDVSLELTGTVKIKGNAKVGSTLMAEITDSNNRGKFGYIWSADGIEIQGATGSTYLIKEGDLGKVITVAVTSNTENGTLISGGTTRTTQPAVPNSHVIINQVYGGGNKEDTPINYSFIELYNPTAEDISLAGYTLNYFSNGDSDGGTGGEVRTMELAGTIKAGTSYLIRGAAETTTTENLKFSVDSYDLEWDQSIDNKRYQLTLQKGMEHIDGVSVAEAAVEAEGPALAGGFVSKQKSIRRKNLADTDSNLDDFEAITYQGITQEALELYRPRTQADGKWGGMEDPEDPEDPEEPEDPDPILVMSISLDRKNALISKGKTITLNPTVLPANAENKTVTYISSDPKTATVSTNGVVKGIRKGAAVITAQAGTKTATCSITVAEVTLNVTKVTMQVKQKTSLLKIASKYPGSDTVAKWTSSNTGVAKVTNKGVVTAKKVGNAVITVTMKSGATASYNLKVIKRAVKTTRLTVNKKSVTIKKGDTFKIKIQRKPITANDKVTYTSNKSKIANVSSSGKIKGIKKGNAKITVKAGNKKVRIRVKVK